MKKILILFEGRTEETNPFGKNETLKRVYERLFRIAEKKNVRLFRAGIKNFKKGIFSTAWEYKRKWIKLRNVSPDLIYDKCAASQEYNRIKLEIQKYVRMINSPELSRIADDKALTVKIFPSISPRTFLINNNAQLKKQLKKIRTSKVVIKPISGSGGAGVIFLERNKLLKRQFETKRFPAVLQEFIDTSSGIKGVIKGVHDLRSVIINGNIHHSLLRLAKKGSLACNIARGAKERYLPKNKTPRSVKIMVRKIDNRLRRYGKRIYCIDFMVDQNQKLWLVELNSRPGLYGYTKENGYPKNFHEKFLSDIMNVLKSG